MISYRHDIISTQVTCGAKDWPSAPITKYDVYKTLKYQSFMVSDRQVPLIKSPAKSITDLEKSHTLDEKPIDLMNECV